MQFCKHCGPRKKAAGTQCIDRKWQSLKKWIPKELSNKQKFTRDLNESIRDCVFAFVCRTNWGNANTLKNPADLASKCWVPKKKRVRNACNTIWWWYPIELRINGLRVAQIPSKRPNHFFYTNQKCCKGSEFYGCLGLQTSKISGTVVPTWPSLSQFTGFYTSQMVLYIFHSSKLPNNFLPLTKSFCCLPATPPSEKIRRKQKHVSVSQNTNASLKEPGVLKYVRVPASVVVPADPQ